MVTVAVSFIVPYTVSWNACQTSASVRYHMARSNSAPNIVILRSTDESTRSRLSLQTNLGEKNHFGDKSLRKSIRKRLRNLFPRTSSTHNLQERRSSNSGSLGFEDFVDWSRGSSPVLGDTKVSRSCVSVQDLYHTFEKEVNGFNT